MKSQEINKAINKLYVQLLAQESKTVCFTSASINVGITTIAHVLAEKVTTFGRKVLYCDFGNYNTSLSKRWNIVYEEKSANILEDAYDCIKFVPKLGFFLMPLPGPRPYETSLITKEGLIAFFDKLKGVYDLIIIDCNSFNKYQPYALSTRYLCEVADATILIILSGRDTKENIKDTVTNMRKMGAKLMGCIMNDLYCQRLVEELCDETNYLNKHAPDFAELLRKKMRASILLNIDY